MKKESMNICHHWNVHYNPFGCGLVLAVDRGVNCENHTHIISAHCTNTPDMATVEKYVEDNRKALTEKINAFVELMHNMDGDWDQKEGIAALFCTYLIRKITNDCEAIEAKNLTAQ